MSGVDSEPEKDGRSSSGAEKQQDAGRFFNPTGSYFRFLATLVLSYAVFFLFGYSLVVILMLYLVVVTFREVSYIAANVTHGLARKAAYLNTIISLIFFLILVVNSLALSRYGYQVILPEFENMTFICPLFITLSLYGCRNIRLMYGPSETL